jgi:hypothetical protein
MAAWLPNPLEPGRNVLGKQSSEITESILEDAGETQIVGAPLVFTAGVAAECATDPATVNGFAATAGRDLASDDTEPLLKYRPNHVGQRTIGSLKEALNTVNIGTTVGLIKEGSDWVFSTTATNKKFSVVRKDTRAGASDTYARIEVKTDSV